MWSCRKKTSNVPFDFCFTCMRYLDATGKFLMALNEQGDRLVGCVTFWRTGIRLCLDTLRQVGMCMIRRQPLLRVHIHDPLHSAEGARFVDIENISPDSIPVRQDDSHDWRTVYHHQFHTLFDTTNGPLWRLVFMPNAYSTHKELDENSSKPAELNHMSEEMGVSERTPSIGPSQESSAELLHCCTIVFGFHHCIVDGSSLMHFLGEFVEALDALLQSVPVPMKQHPVYKSMAECMPRMSEQEWDQWEAIHWGQPATTQSSPDWDVTGFTHIKPVDPAHRTTGVMTMVTDTKTTKRFLASCRQHQCTVQGAVQTVLGSALAAVMTRGTQTSFIQLTTHDVFMWKLMLWI